MATFSFENLGEAYVTAWPKLKYVIPAAQEATKQTYPLMIKGTSLPTEVEYTLQGAPMFFSVYLKHAKLPGGFVRLPNEPLITVSGTKTVVKTAVAGTDGSFKEIISCDDYQINIKGLATIENPSTSPSSSGSIQDAQFPSKALKAIINLYEINDAIEVVCPLLAYFNISHLVIENVNWPGVEGAFQFFPYEISAISDRPFTLELLQD